MNIREDKSRTVGDRSLAFRIEELKVEDTDILTFDFESVVFGYLKEVVVHIKWTLKVPTIVEVRSSGELWWTFVGTFTTKVFIRTSTIARETCCSLIYGLLHLFVLKIGSKGHLKGTENDLRRIVNINSWYIEPRLYRPCSKIYYTRDRYYYPEHLVEPFVDSYVLSFLLVYKIGERLNDIFYRSLHIHRFERSK